MLAVTLALVMTLALAPATAGAEGIRIELHSVPPVLIDMEEYLTEDGFYDVPAMYYSRIRGTAIGVNPDEHSVIAFLDNRWIKPFWASFLTEIEENGDFSLSVTTGGVDVYLDEFELFIVKTSDFTDENGSALTVNGVAEKAVYRTGTLRRSESIYAEPILLGDVNGDGIVSLLDALEILRYVVGAPNVIAGNPLALAAADVNGDGVINTADALETLKMAMTAR